MQAFATDAFALLSQEQLATLTLWLVTESFFAFDTGHKSQNQKIPSF